MKPPLITVLKLKLLSMNLPFHSNRFLQAIVLISMRRMLLFLLLKSLAMSLKNQSSLSRILLEVLMEILIVGLLLPLPRLDRAYPKAFFLPPKIMAWRL